MNSSSSSFKSSAGPMPLQRLRLAYLDGLRGFAAVFVVVHHLHQELVTMGALPMQIARAFKWIQLGHFAVDLFIVLSGYSLMMPVVRSKTKSLELGFGAYLRRRARRILPPYYASLALTLVVILLVPGMRDMTGSIWDLTLPALTWGAVLSHLLLVHNWFAAWALKINTPLWSVATEWQIYFIFPLVLLPVWKRFGAIAMLLVGGALGLTLGLAMRQQMEFGCPWYIGLFAMGMLAAIVNFDRSSEPAKYGHVSGSVTIFAIAMLALLIKWVPDRLILCDFVAGIAASSFLIYATGLVLTGRAREMLIMRCLESRIAIGLGGISYSLYLVHFPLIALTRWLLQNINAKPEASGLLMTVIVLPMIFVVTYAFHNLFERPFQNLPRERNDAEINTTTHPSFPTSDESSMAQAVTLR
jgi:peptidoglycan/LPS O-acetylase OafA/YrhL